MNKRKVDPLTLSIIKGRLDSFNIELGDRVSNQAFSFATAHLRDLGCGLLDKHVRTITSGDFFPAAGGGMDIAVQGMLDWVGRDGIKPDDFILGNDAFIVRWGHMADWTFVRPIFYQGELVFYHCLKTHQYDTGGAFRDAYYPGLFDSHGESLMIPPLKLMKEGKLDETVYSLILRNVRGSAMVRSDNLLVYASMKKVEDRILDLFKTYGKDNVLTACNEIIERTETAVRHAISSWPAGTYKAERAADWDGTTDKQVWIRLSLTIKSDEGQLIFDFSDSDPAVDYINLNLGRLWGSIVSAVAWTLPSGTSVNQGLANCIKIITRKGTVLDPVYPATTGGSVITGNIACECALIALGQAIPESTSALWTRHMNPMLVGRRRDRIDPRSGTAQAFTVMGFQSDGGNGAIWGHDGTDSYGPVNAGGNIKKAPVEVEEWEAPYRWLRWEFVTDASGHGQWRGGLGTRVEIMNTYDPRLWQPHDCLVQTGNFEGEKSGSLGLLGGSGGAPHQLGIKRNGKNVKIRTLSAAYLQPGDIIWTKSGGGGGVGDPLKRDPEKVRWDVLNEYVSYKVAKNIYGVIIDPKNCAIDYEATKVKREKLQAKRSEKG